MEKRITIKSILAILAAGLFSFSGVLIETATNITFPTLMKEFHVSTSTVQWMTSGNLLVLGLLIPISSYLKKRYSTKKLFLSAAFIFLIGLIVDLFAHTFLFLLLGRIIQGIGVGIALPMMYNIILEESPSSMLGSMMGIGSFVTAAAPALGPTFGGFMISYYSWRYIFAAVVPIVILAMLIGYCCISDHPGNKNENLDKTGFILISITFISLMFGFSNLDKVKTQLFRVIIYFAIGMICLFLFLNKEKENNHPLIKIEIFKNKKFSYHILAIMFLHMTTLGFGLLLPTYVQIVFEKNAMNAGLVLLPGSIIGAVCAPIGGILLDKFGARKPIMLGATLSFTSVLTYMILFDSLNYSVCCLFYAIYMFGLGLMMGNTMTSALSSLNNNQQADGNASLQTLQQLSGGIGTSISAAILAFSQSNESLKLSTQTGTYYVILFFIVTTLFVLLSQNKALKENNS